jgi:guanylate kinase
VEKELTFEGKFDRVIVNDEISTASSKATALITAFLDSDKQKPTDKL